LRSFVAYRDAHEEELPLSPADALLLNEPDPQVLQQRKKPVLSDGFIEKISAASYQNLVDTEIKPVLQVVNYSDRFEGSQGLQKQSRRIRLQVKDSGNKMILAVVSAGLVFEARAQLSTGQSIIQLNDYTVVQYQDKESSTRRPGLIVLSYTYKCRPAHSSVGISKLEDAIRMAWMEIPVWRHTLAG
jgi:hypothetical protein